MSATDEETALRRAMAEAVAAQDYETATRLRDQLNALGPGSRLTRPEPGERMGLGTDTPAHKPPEGWTPPKRPDPLTTGTKRRGRRR
jgi:hypothetical protein